MPALLAWADKISNWPCVLCVFPHDATKLTQSQARQHVHIWILICWSVSRQYTGSLETLYSILYLILYIMFYNYHREREGFLQKLSPGKQGKFFTSHTSLAKMIWQYAVKLILVLEKMICVSLIILHWPNIILFCSFQWRFY